MLSHLVNVVRAKPLAEGTAKASMECMAYHAVGRAQRLKSKVGPQALKLLCFPLKLLTVEWRKSV